MMAIRNDEEQFQNLSKEIDRIIAGLYGFSEEEFNETI